MYDINPEWHSGTKIWRNRLSLDDKLSVSRKMMVGAGWMIAWRLGSRVLGFASTLILARLLAPSDFGLLAMAVTFSTAVDAVSQIGLGDALVRREEQGLRLHNTAFTLQVLRGVITGATVALAAPLASKWFAEPRLTPLLFVLAGLSVLSSFENIGIVEYRRDMHYGMQFRLLIVPRVAQVIVGIFSALLLESYWALLIAIGMAKVMRLLMTYVLHPFRPRPSLACWRDLVGFSIWSWAASIARLFWDRLDAFVLGPFFGARQLGVYLLGTEMAMLPISELVEPAAGVLFPGFVAARNGGTDPVGLAFQVVSMLLLGTVPLAIMISASAGSFVRILLGPQWVEAQPIIEIFSYACMLSPFSYVGSSILVSGSHVRRDFQVMAVASFAKGVLVYMAALSGNVRLVAVAIFLSVALEALLFTLQLCAIGNPRIREELSGLCRTAAAGSAVCAALYGCGVGWAAAPLSVDAALLRCVTVGLLVFGIYALVQSALWWFAGRPNGPEQQALRIAGHFMRPLQLQLLRVRHFYSAKRSR
jgi:lipopolysaccharide exporter